MRHLRLSVLSVLSAALLSGPTVPLRVPSPRHDMIVKHKWDDIPDNWISLGPPPDDTTVDLHIALEPKHKNALTDVLYEVSQPGHPKYGAHLSREQVAELVAPHPNTLELVSSWLQHSGVPPSSISRTHGGGWLTATDVPVSHANDLLGASYQLYYHDGRNDTILRTAGYALPAALHVHVKAIVPTTAFTHTRPLQRTPRRPSDQAAVLNATLGEPVNMLSHRQQMEIGPSALRTLYKTTTYVPPVAASSRLGIVSYNDEHPNLRDQARFMHRFMTGAIEETVTWGTIDEEVQKGENTERANLFAQFAAAIAYPIPITFYRGTGVRLRSTGNRKVSPTANDAIHQWLRYAVDQDFNPHTIGLISEGTRELNLPPDYMDAVCGLFEELGARGVTVLVPSGDNGVGTDKSKRFSVNFPASCPYVTSVGGTTEIPEVASSFSGGGFSNHFPVHDYQKTEVNYFVENLGNKYRGLYEPGGRGVPDIAAQSSGYAYVFERSTDRRMDSTVCSTSTAAAIFSLLNDHRLSLGLKPLGFLNPLLYGVGSFGLTDIEKGNNPGARTVGFDAEIGWDPVTGLGTPDFQILLLIAKLYRQPGEPPARRNQSFHDQP